MSIEKGTFENSPEKTRGSAAEVKSSTQFEEYANFQDTEARLPVKDIDFETVHSGSFSSVIPLDNERILKINRAQERYGQEEYLVRKTEDKDTDRKDVIESMQRLANEKRENYALLQNYIGEYIPKLELLVISESPRKQLEEVMANFSEEVLEKVPETEIALLEIWENAHPEFEMREMERVDLKRILKESQNREFASGVSRLLFEKRKWLDIADDAGISIAIQNGTHERAWELEDVLRVLLSKDIIAYPRNTTAPNDKLMFYDLYPIFDVPQDVSDKELKQLASLVNQSDVDALRKVVEENQKLRQHRLGITRYLILLKKMGADLEEN